MAFYLLYKAARRDFTYHLPLEGVLGLTVSGLMRATVKFVVDFAAIIQFRHPYDVGGLYFSLNMFLPLLGLTFLLGMDLVAENLSESTSKLLTSLVMILGGSLLILVGVFLSLMNKEYHHTFFSVETGGQLLRRLFLDGDDLSKAQVFKKHKSLWAPIRDKVAVWVKEGWASWEEEKPDWFTDKWKASVPEHMKPVKKTGDIDDGDKTADENEGQETLIVGGGEEQKGRRRSVLEVISGQKSASSKVMPAGGEAKKEIEIDAEDFVREMNRRGSINM
eukprot:CAMPEP_0182518868 /NCGR_PEP_ID=MMETSP1321-20130603/44797_1 /TAXON_ID=91990 /ORGANISM="Bolidomonas sp., Strain RCC1657" /LENGTH=276 /DNA_ID=CAMNT_0024726809 /DNA_START=100 /DNA_END=930 /DNA_ORIENTATION=+